MREESDKLARVGSLSTPPTPVSVVNTAPPAVQAQAPPQPVPVLGYPTVINVNALPRGGSGWKIVSIALFIILILVLGFGAWRWWNEDPTQMVTRSIAERLRSDAILEVAMQRIEYKVTVTKSDESGARTRAAILGRRRGVLTCSVMVKYGFKMDHVSERDVRDQAGAITVKLPDPEVLSFEVVRADFKPDRSPLELLYDAASKKLVGSKDLREELEAEVKPTALKELEKEAPKRPELVERLNARSAELFPSVKRPVRFE